jgi:hypothetical protein
VAPWSGMRQAPGHALPFHFICVFVIPYWSCQQLRLYSAQNDNIINQSWIWQHEKGSCSGLILCLFRHLLGLYQESHEYLGQDNRWPSQDSNRACPHKSRKHCNFVEKQTSSRLVFFSVAVSNPSWDTSSLTHIAWTLNANAWIVAQTLPLHPNPLQFFIHVLP